jgi:hypothetical protein
MGNSQLKAFNFRRFLPEVIPHPEYHISLVNFSRVTILSLP